jgi:hypothetical protein
MKPKYTAPFRTVLVAIMTLYAALSSGMAGTCYTTTLKTVCRCVDCTYVVLCTANIGVGGNVVGVVFCNATNPGRVTTDVTTASAGYSGTACSYLNSCGKATPTGTCCGGGSRTSIQDWSFYTSCAATGSPCQSWSTGIAP